MHKKFILRGLACLYIAIATPAAAQDADSSAILAVLERLEQRISTLENQNNELRAKLEAQASNPQLNAPAMPLENAAYAPVQAQPMPSNAVIAMPQPVAAMPQPVAVAAPPQPFPPYSAPQEKAERNLVANNSGYGYKMLDHAERVTDKPLVQLEHIADGELNNTVTISGGATALVNAQFSNKDSKFGWLMRHPTSNNQIGKSVSEAVLHSAQLAVTARPLDNVTAYAELLYDPQQSFGAGSITGLNRNQIQLRRGWLMYGNLEEHPFYALVGKMDVPFGLNDTVSPFTNSSNWHAFAGLAYGAQAGLKLDGLHVRAMAVQGGQQFRSASTPVEGTTTPSKLNNFAVDARYKLAFNSRGDSAMVGGSYMHGTAYCTDYPVVHFNPCADNAPAWSAYGKVNYGPVQLLGEYAKTTTEWPGTKVPDPTNPLSEFDAVKAESFTLGARLGLGKENDTEQQREFALSGEFSKFIAGDDGAPWERQNQIVLGLSWFPSDSVNLFSEYVHVDGYVPLNFLSGGNQPNGATWSESDAKTDVFLIGAQIAF